MSHLSRTQAMARARRNRSRDFPSILQTFNLLFLSLTLIPLGRISSLTVCGDDGRVK